MSVSRMPACLECFPGEAPAGPAAAAGWYPSGSEVNPVTRKWLLISWRAGGPPSGGPSAGVW